MKRTMMLLLSFLLILSTVLPVSTSAEVEEEGSVAAKNEVVYATLSPNGDGKELYVVNNLEVEEKDKVIDYGSYHNLKNLTDLSELSQTDDKVEITAPEGKFYYQGDLEETDLPWEFEITYLLDGETVKPEELGGADGELEIQIKTKENENMDSIFYENYLLQISFPFDGEKTRNIETEDGMLANAGKDILVTFTVMPEEAGSFFVSADVEAFELSGIDINAVPQNMSIDAPDTEEFTEDIVTLSDALQEIDAGVLALKNGTADLHDGTSTLRDGSLSYYKGVAALNNGSSELIEGSSSINESLEVMSDSLEGEIDDRELGDMEVVTSGLSELAESLREIEAGLNELKSNYGLAYEALNEAMDDIPADSISEEEIASLYQSGADPDTVDKLVGVYEAALVAKGTYDEIKQAFTAVESTLETITPSLNTMATSIEETVEGFTDLLDSVDISSGISELQEGIRSLSENYQVFHDGLLAYTDGVGELASSYEDLDNGIGDLHDGVGELTGGVTELQDGTSELARATENLPEQVTEEIDEMLSQYDGSDFEAVSFVSEKNENVNSVQFVLKTEPIEIEEAKEDQETVEKEKSLWEKFLDLFRG